MRGQIVKISSDMHVVSSQKEKYCCKCRGIFRHNHIVPLVGDFVEFDPQQKVIDEILPRKNEFKRPAVSNIDQAFLITSLKQPDFSLDLLDKLLVLMELHQVKAIICISKEDLLSEEEKKRIFPCLDYYKKIGYQVVSNQDLHTIETLLAGKTSVFTGQTGAGKSTLLNQLNPNWQLETGEISLALGRGRHTTRVVELFEFLGGQVLDTPGFSALDFLNYDREQVKDAFIEFAHYPCPFKDCQHTNEQECAVKQAVRENHILESRYNHYLKFIERR